MKFALLITVVAAQVFAAPPPPSEKRVSALILPMDKGSEALTLKVESFANEALKEYQGFNVRTSDDLFGIAADEEAGASFKRAEMASKRARPPSTNATTKTPSASCAPQSRNTARLSAP